MNLKFILNIDHSKLIYTFVCQDEEPQNQEELNTKLEERKRYKKELEKLQEQLKEKEEEEIEVSCINW